jgi:hypothetical protein
VPNVDALELNDRELSRALAPEEKLAQALEMMSVGYALKRASLRQRVPPLTECEIDQLLAAWLVSDG